MKGCVEAKHLKGFRDYLPSSSFLKNKIKRVIQDYALRCGYSYIETPCLEYEEVLLGEGGETEKQVYKLEDHGGRKLGLRFDLTVPFTRFVAEHQGELSFPFKRLEIGEVWRGEKPQKGRQRQFAQADLDIIGVDSLAADIEILFSLSFILNSLVPEEKLSMYLGNRKILSSLIKASFPECFDKIDSFETEVLIILDKLEKIGVQACLEMLEKISSDKLASQKLLDIIYSSRNNQSLDETVSFLKERLSNEDFIEVGKEIERYLKTCELVCSLGFKNIKYVLDLSIARGLGYYTGIVFETKIDRLSNFGSISSGGRYNNLVSRFGGSNLEGVGGSVGVDRLIQAIEELDLFKYENPSSVFITVASEEERGYAFGVLKTLRMAGICSDISLKETKLSNQFKLANRMGVDFVITVGEDEKKDGVVSLKNMKTSEEVKLNIEEAISKIKKDLKI